MAAVAFLLVGAHFLRGDEVDLVAVALGAAGAACLGRSSWVRWVLVGLLVAAAGVWVQTGTSLAGVRLRAGAPWVRMALILTSVTGFTLAAGLVLAGSRGRRLFPVHAATTRLQVAVFAAVAVILAALHLAVPRPLLLAERYLPGWGWLELFLVAAYAAVVSALLLDPRRSIRTRIWVWGGFSVVFFTQLGLGILGLERMLMTGQLHLPVPALILAGPLYRGEGIFMLALFLATVVLVGPAWCSYLCYIGAWDGAASACRRVSAPLPAWVGRVRAAILVAVLVAALALRQLGAPLAVAVLAAAAFGLLGVGLMLAVSRRLGTMVHCRVWCPAGLAADLLGKISPWRIRISEDCTRCGRCIAACRYDALSLTRLEQGRPGLSCSLCGDCVSVCPHAAITYRLPGTSPATARTVFVGLVTVLHAVFLAVARI